MASSHLSAADESRQSSTSHLTLGWFARRSALWLLSVAAGVTFACFLYAYADDSNTASAAKPAVSATQQAQAR
jgi:hypothetical protein